MLQKSQYIIESIINNGLNNNFNTEDAEITARLGHKQHSPQRRKGRKEQINIIKTLRPLRLCGEINLCKKQSFKRLVLQRGRAVYSVPLWREIFSYFLHSFGKIPG